MVSNQKKIPYFIKIGGCHNCKVRQAYTTDSGTFYDEGHAFHAKCIHKVACLVPSVAEVRKVRICSEDMESNCLFPKTSLNLERVIL